MELNIGIAGLGLIGGSMAKAIKKKTSHTIIGFDIVETVVTSALNDRSIDLIGRVNAVCDLDILFVSLYPSDAVRFVSEQIEYFKNGCIIVDLCGVKEYVCNELDRLCVENGLVFIGGHPMAGREFSGYYYATAELFDGSSMILTPVKSSTEIAIETVTQLFYAIGFGKVVQTTPDNHDRMIAFTSQLAHVVSSAYIKSPEALMHNGYSAGSYKDLTRVAKLNEHMWTELFIKNKSPLVNEIDEIIKHLTEYRSAIDSEDYVGLTALLRDGRERKESMG